MLHAPCCEAECWVGQYHRQQLTARLPCRNDVKLVVSSSPPNHAIYDAIIKAALPKSCRSLNIEAAFTAQLDDKWEFSELCQQLKLEVPAAYLVTSRARLRELNSSSALKGRRFILKSIAYDSFARTANIFLPCSPKRLEELVRLQLNRSAVSDEHQAVCHCQPPHPIMTHLA